MTRNNFSCKTTPAARFGSEIANDLIMKAQQGDRRALEAVHRGASYIVDPIATKLIRSGLVEYRDDLLQEGAVAVLEAVKAFDPKYGAPFSAFARRKVQSRLAKFADRNRRQVRLTDGKRTRAIYWRFLEERRKCGGVNLPAEDLARLTRELEIEFPEPSKKSVENEGGGKKSMVASVIDFCQSRDASLNAEDDADWSGGGGFRLVQSSHGIEYQVDLKLIREKLLCGVEALEVPLLLAVFEAGYLGEGKTEAEIVEQIGSTRSKVRAATRRLKDLAREIFGETTPSEFER